MLRAKIARLEHPYARADWGVVPLGDPRLDARLPGGGLARGRWHEIAGTGRDRELPAAAAGFAAVLARKAAGGQTILWALQRDDLHPPGLAALGIHPDQLILVRADRDADLLAVLEDALRTRGIGAVVGELGALDLAAGKRLGLACERGGATAFVLRRRLHGKRADEDDATAATTRWRVGPAASETSLFPPPPCGEGVGGWGSGLASRTPPDGRGSHHQHGLQRSDNGADPHPLSPSPQGGGGSAPPPNDEPGLGPPRWWAHLTRCRGGRPGAWILETCDDPDSTPGDVRVVAALADHAAEAPDGRGLPGRTPWPRDHDDGSQRAAAGGGG